MAGLINIRVGRTLMLGWIKSLGGTQRLATPAKDGFFHP